MQNTYYFKPNHLLDNQSHIRLKKVDVQFFYTQVEDLNVSFLIALKAMLDRRDSLGDALIDEARKLLMDGIFYNQGFLAYNDQDVKLLVEWYYQQQGCQPFKRYANSVIKDASGRCRAQP